MAFTTIVRLLRVVIAKILTFSGAGKRRYGLRLWKTFTDVFNWLPVMAVINDRIICFHGGLSPDMTSFDVVNQVR